MLPTIRIRYYLVIVSIPILLLGVSAGSRNADDLEQESLRYQEAVALHVGREIQAFVRTRVSEMEFVERTHGLYAMPDDEITALLGRLLSHERLYEAITVTGLDGRARAQVSRTRASSLDRDASRLLPDPSYWQSNEVFVGNVLYDQALREPLLDIAVPIVDRVSGRTEGALLARTRFRVVWELLADLELSPETEAFVVDTDGRILAHHFPGVVLAEAYFRPPATSGRSELSNGTPALVAVQPLQDLVRSLRVVVTRPLSSALKAAHASRRATLISATTLWLGASILALLVARAVVKPVRELASAADKIAAGDLDTPIHAEGPREISQLGNALRDMTARLKTIIGELEQSGHVERERALVTLEAISDAVIAGDRDGTLTYLNPVASELTGWLPSEAMGRPIRDILDIVSCPGDSDPLAPSLTGGRTVSLSSGTFLRSRAGDQIAVQLSAAPIRGQNNHIAGLVAVLQDISERVEAEERAADAAERLKRSHERLTLVTEVAPVGLCEVRLTGDGEFEFLYVSGRFAEIAGLAPAEISQKPSSFMSVVAQEDRSVLVENLKESAKNVADLRMRFRIFQPDGGMLWVSGLAVPRTDESGGVIWTGVILDVTPDVVRESELQKAHLLAERMRAENEHKALHDGLTGLPNRRFYDKTIAGRMADAGAGGPGDCALVRLDLDRFKLVNDTMGHEAGDLVLIQVATVLQDNLRPGDFAARIGGDEFTVLLAPGSSVEEASDFVSRVQAGLQEPLLFQGRPCRFGASFGIALVDDLTEIGADIQPFADTALYRAKAEGRNRAVFFTPALHTTLLEERQLSMEIQEAIDADQFEPFFQPQVSANDGRLVGVEALLRWQHPTRGTVAPAIFLHVAEQLRVLPEIDRIIMEKSRDCLARWHVRGVTVPKISFNITSVRMHDPEVSRMAREIIAATDTNVTFELLESILVEEEDEDFRLGLEMVRQHGIDIEIDDFGSGHASIISLMEIAPSALKIDQRIVAPVAHDLRARNLVKAIVQIADTLSINVVAEGVETEDQARSLRDIGCSVLQGYHFSRPVSEEQFMTFMKDREQWSA